MNNEKRFFEYRKKKVLKVLFLILSVLVIVLEILALFKVINLLWGLILFLILCFLKKYL